MAREREEDRASGRPERGLFTGRGPRRPRDHDRDRERTYTRSDTEEMEIADDEDMDDERPSRRSRGPAPRTGAKRSVLRAIRQLPSYVRLLFGLISDNRVSRWDKFLVVAAIGYIVSPLDFIPDFIPFLGEVDDIFLLMMALQRLVENTGRRVLMDHWRGDPRDLSELNLAGIISAAGFFLPAGIRRRLRGMARRKGR